MTVSTTFGYSATEDRIWLSCDAWPQRVWFPRRLVRGILRITIAQLEAQAGGAQADDERPPSERIAAAHDASLNKPRPGERGRALQMGREDANAPALQTAVLCTRFVLERPGEHFDLVFHTPAGQRRLRLSRTGLHRWLHALHMVLQGSDWADWPAAPDWLTRSYLPPALQSLLTLPPDGLDLEGDADEGDAPRPGP
ncbi:MAG: hypothetical protein Q4G70_04430 [Pseudomonadota bacterium]|nr:hypothetical protein [Pseudomonadota bacterium]